MILNIQYLCNLQLKAFDVLCTYLPAVYTFHFINEILLKPTNRSQITSSLRYGMSENWKIDFREIVDLIMILLQSRIRIPI